jgi:hypothetical protein
MTCGHNVVSAKDTVTCVKVKLSVAVKNLWVKCSRISSETKSRNVKKVKGKKRIHLSSPLDEQAQKC